MNDTTFSRSHLIQPFFSFRRKPSEMSKRSQESSSPGSPMVKAKACCLVSRQCVSLGQDYSSNPNSPESTRDSQVWPWEERNEKSRWYSVQHASGNRARDKSFRTLETNSDTMKASRTYRSTLRRCTFRYGRDLWLHRCRQHCTWTELRREFGIVQEFWIWEHIKGLFGIAWMMIKGNSEIKNVFPADIASSLWKKPVWLKEQALKWTKARVYVYSDSVLCLSKLHGPEVAIRRWNDEVSTLKMCKNLQRIARIRWRSDWLRVESLPKSQSIGPSPQNSSRPTRKEHHTWKIQWSNNLHVNVQWHWTGKER